MELREVITARRSVRRYQATPIPREVLEELLEAACWAPSGVNRQPWYFVVLSTPEEIDQMKSRLEQIAEGVRPLLESRFPTYPEILQETMQFIRSMGGAPVYVLAFLQRDYPDKEPMIFSVAAAIENMLLAAWEKGIGSCWLYAANEAGYAEALRQMYAPDKGGLVSMIALGYPDQLPKAPPRKSGRWEFR